MFYAVCVLCDIRTTKTLYLMDRINILEARLGIQDALQSE